MKPHRSDMPPLRRLPAIHRCLLIGLAALAACLPLSASWAAPPVPSGAGVTVTVDTDATKAVLGAVLNPTSDAGRRAAHRCPARQSRADPQGA